MENQFTVTDLFKHMLRNAWWIIVLGVVGGGAMYVMNKQPAATSYSATRSMYVAKSNTGVKDPNSRIVADSWLLKTYKTVAKDDKVIKPAVKALKAEGVKVSADTLRSEVSLSITDGTLLMKAKAKGIAKPKQAIKIVNAFAESYAENAPKLISDMPKPELMTKTKEADTDTMVAGSPKKAALFGAVAGWAIGIVLAFFVGVYKNVTATKN